MNSNMALHQMRATSRPLLVRAGVIAMNTKLKNQIQTSINSGLDKLDQYLVDWANSHLCEQKK